MMTYSAPDEGSVCPKVISPASRLAGTWSLTAATALSAPASATTVATTASFVPFWVPETAAFVSAYVYNGSAPGGNVDVGIYDAAGNRLGSTGATARSGASAIQRIALTGTVTLYPGNVYYMAISDSAATTNGTFAWSAQINNGKWAGLYRMTSAHALPNPATFATWASQVLPVFGISQFAF